MAAEDLNESNEAAYDGSVVFEGDAGQGLWFTGATTFITGEKRADSYRISYQLEPTSHLGPLAGSEQLEIVDRYVQIGKAEGAKWGPPCDCAMSVSNKKISIRPHSALPAI